MAELTHPAYHEEQAHLTSTLSIIDQERAIAQRELKEAEGELSYARMYDPDALPLREMLYTRSHQRLKNLGLAHRRPYFTRVDFAEAGGENRTYYIGKYGVLKSDSLEVEVVDWRSPVANLYYSGQVGPMHYEAPDGQVDGELTLKRQIGIEDSQLVTIFDTDVVSQDAYLQSVLGAMSGDRLREIVTTIQAEQNFVIRHPLGVSLVVQGVAGSGKTTIALHRVAYLLYAFQDKLQPEHMLILAPNPLFLNYISGVLPDLGVERVRQTTFALLMAGWLSKALPRVDTTDRLEAMLGLSDGDRARLSRVARFKGSLEMGRQVEAWMKSFEQRFIPEGDILFGPVKLYTHQQLRDFLLVDLAPFPLNRRVSEFKKQLSRRAKQAALQVQQWLSDECDRRVDRIKQQMPDGEERRSRIIKLYDSRDARMKQAKDQVRPFIQNTLKRFPDMQPMDCYRAFWEEACDQAEEDSALYLAAEHTLDRMDAGKPLEPEDVAPLALMAMRLTELPRMDIRHVIIDEAQDFSPLEFALLRRITQNASMTVVGDLMQGVNAWRGLSDWRELTDGVFHGDAVQHFLVTSYRNTIEIMQAALRVARNRPTPGQREAQPVLRHGPEPLFLAVSGAAQRVKRVTELTEAWKREGMTTIAIIGRHLSELKALMKKLPEALEVTLLDVDRPEYTGGVLAAPASAVKGLEFDGVIMLNANEQCFPDQELDARLLYVCLTRPLHRLAVLYEGALSPLLAE